MKEGMKFDTGKLRWDLLPIECVEDVVKVLTMGAAKYADNNWQQVENANERYYAALLRHLSQWRKGEVTDQESGLPHLAHVLCNVIFLQWLEKQRQQTANTTTNTNYPHLGETGTGAPYVGNGYTNVS